MIGMKTPSYALILLIASLAAPSARAYDLKAKAAEFTEELRAKLNETEDKLTQDSRAFVDELKRQWREQEARIDQETTDSDDWKKAKQNARREKQNLARDFRQRARVHGEEVELQINRFAQEREKEAKRLLDDMQARVEEFRKSKGYNDARRDLSDAKHDIEEVIRKWRERLRELRNSNRDLKFE